MKKIPWFYKTHYCQWVVETAIEFPFSLPKFDIWCSKVTICVNWSNTSNFWHFCETKTSHIDLQGFAQKPCNPWKRPGLGKRMDHYLAGRHQCKKLPICNWINKMKRAICTNQAFHILNIQCIMMFQTHWSIWLSFCCHHDLHTHMTQERGNLWWRHHFTIGYICFFVQTRPEWHLNSWINKLPFPEIWKWTSVRWFLIVTSRVKQIFIMFNGVFQVQLLVVLVDKFDGPDLRIC